MLKFSFQGTQNFLKLCSYLSDPTFLGSNKIPSPKPIAEGGDGGEKRPASKFTSSTKQKWKTVFPGKVCLEGAPHLCHNAGASGERHNQIGLLCRCQQKRPQGEGCELVYGNSLKNRLQISVYKINNNNKQRQNQANKQAKTEGS